MSWILNSIQLIHWEHIFLQTLLYPVRKVAFPAWLLYTQKWAGLEFSNYHALTFMGLQPVINNTWINHMEGLANLLIRNIYADTRAHKNSCLTQIWTKNRLHFTLLKYFSINSICTKIKNPKSNSPMERVYQVKYNILISKYLDDTVFNYIDPWCETLSSIAWSIISPCRHNLNSTPHQAVFGRYRIIFLMQIVDRWVINTEIINSTFIMFGLFPHESDMTMMQTV